jgi:hypothetical protein
MLVVRFDIASYISHISHHSYTNPCANAGINFDTGFAACTFEDGFVIHVVSGTLAAGLK